jgi:hypothetical protein
VKAVQKFSNIRLIASNKSEKMPHTSAARGKFWIERMQKSLSYQSVHERDFLEMAEYADEITDIQREPFSIRYFDEVDKKDRSYTPDYLAKISVADELEWSLIVEIKKGSEYDLLRTSKWNTPPMRGIMACQHWAIQNEKTKMIVLTDRSLKRHGINNIRLINSRRTSPIDEVAMRFLRKVFVNHVALSLRILKSLASDACVNDSDLMTALLNLCATDSFSFDVSKQMTEDTIFYAQPKQRIFF